MTQFSLWGERGRTDTDDVLTRLQVDYTPVGVALQLLLALLEIFADLVTDVALDPAAGSGCWGRAMRAICGPRVHLIGIEERASESHNLAAAYDEHYIGDGLTSLVRPKRRPNLIATNPHFRAFETAWPAEFRDRQILAPGGIVAFYGLSQWGQTLEAAPHLARWSPAMQLRVGGRVGHRGKGTQRLAPIPQTRRQANGPTHELRENGGDSREVSLWIWTDTPRTSSRRPSWRTEQLPILPEHLRCWQPTSVPGTFPIEPALVEEVRRYL